MTERRRQPETNPRWRSRDTTRYTAAGALLGLGSPFGALLLRLASVAPAHGVAWVRSELAANLFLYAYMAGGTMGAFGLFGFWLGRRSDRQRSHNAELETRVEALRLESITDGLTGAYSHAYILESAAVELAGARRLRHPLSVLMADLDEFKRVNDTHGHLFGDLVLRTVAAAIEGNVRDADVVGRYGGEEFLVVMPGADGETAYEVAERVRRAVEALEIAAAGGAKVAPRLSIGVATSAGPEETAERLIARADERLYAAKRAGRNRTAR